MSDTPRTDRIEDVPMGFMPETSVVEADFARTLERELSESEGVINVWRGRTQRAEAELTRLRAELSEAEQSSAHNAALYFRAKERADAAIATTEHLRADVEALRADAERARKLWSTEATNG